MPEIKLRDINPVYFQYKVGIGEAVPDESLVVVGRSRIEGAPASSGGDNFVGAALVLKSTDNTSNWSGISWKDKDDKHLWSLANDLDDQNGTDELSLRAAHGTDHDGGGVRVFTIKPNGHIGWGFKTPQRHFHIGGSLGGVIQLTNDSIGNGAGDGTIIEAQTDKHFYIDNREGTGGVGLRTQGYTGYWLDMNQDTALGGGATGSGALQARLHIFKGSIPNDTIQNMLCLQGKFLTEDLGLNEEGVAIAVRLADSENDVVDNDVIKFVHRGGYIDTWINNSSGKVKIGQQATQSGPNGNLEVTSTGATKVRIYGANDDSYISFGDGGVNFYAGIEEDYGIFRIGVGSGAPGSGTDSISIWGSAGDDELGWVGIGTGSTAPTSKLQVKDGQIRLTDAYAINWDGNNILLHDGTNTKIGDGSASDAVIVAGGKVGIGTGSTGIEAKLHIEGGTSSARIIVNSRSAQDNSVGIGWGPVGSALDSGAFLIHKGTSNDFEINNSGAPNSTITFLTRPSSGSVVERLRISSEGKLLAGAGSDRKSLIRHFRDTESSQTDLKICSVEDHDFDIILYKHELADIREDDIITINTNWGIFESDLSYNPDVYFGLILAKEKTTDFGDTENTDYIKILEPLVTHVQVPVIPYGDDLTSGATITDGNHYESSGDNFYPTGAKAFDDNENTYWGMEMEDDNRDHVKVDFGASTPKTISLVRIRPLHDLDDDWGDWGGVNHIEVAGTNSTTDHDDNSTWTVLHEGYHANNDNWVDHVFVNSTAYRYYRIWVESSYTPSAWAAIREIEMMEGSAPGETFPQEQQIHAMYKVTAADVAAGRNCVNFVLWAADSVAPAACTDTMKLSGKGQLDILQIHGALSD